MNLDLYIERLSSNAKAFQYFCEILTDEQSIWRQSPEKWSIQQIIYHLWRTEEKDFRPRLEKTLRDPNEDWTLLLVEEMRLEQIDGGENKLNVYLQNFLAEREKSIVWLKTIESPNWENQHRHNEKIILAAGDLITSWLVHDYLHLKQLLRVQYDFVNSISEPFKTDYAGKWT